MNIAFTKKTFVKITVRYTADDITTQCFAVLIKPVAPPSAKKKKKKKPEKL